MTTEDVRIGRDVRQRHGQGLCGRHRRRQTESAGPRRRRKAEGIVWGRLRVCFPNFVRKWAGDHPQQELAKFGYKPERKVECIFGTLLYFGDMLEPVG
jgi:hypothetical protein